MTEEDAKKLEAFRKKFKQYGIEKGKLIAKLACQLPMFEGKELQVFPMYRSALILDDIDNGNLSGYHFHDPAWMGEDVNITTIQGYMTKIDMIGQRSGIDIYKDDNLCMPTE